MSALCVDHDPKRDGNRHHHNTYLHSFAANYVRVAAPGIATDGVEQPIIAEPALAFVPPALAVHDLYGHPRAPLVVFFVHDIWKLCDRAGMGVQRWYGDALPVWACEKNVESYFVYFS